jgi:hypothetical protein
MTPLNGQGWSDTRPGFETRDTSHILESKENQRKYGSVSFEWDVFLFGGVPKAGIEPPPPAVRLFQAAFRL